MYKSTTGGDVKEYLEEGADALTDCVCDAATGVGNFLGSETGHRVIGVGLVAAGTVYGVNSMRTSALVAFGVTAVISAGANHLVSTAVNQMPSFSMIGTAAADTVRGFF